MFSSENKQRLEWTDMSAHISHFIVSGITLRKTFDSSISEIFNFCKFAKLLPSNSCWLSLLARRPNNSSVFAAVLALFCTPIEKKAHILHNSWTEQHAVSHAQKKPDLLGWLSGNAKCPSCMSLFVLSQIFAFWQQYGGPQDPICLFLHTELPHFRFGSNIDISWGEITLK